MRYPNFVGASNVTQSYVADQEETINWYVEILDQGSTSDRALLPTPGVTTLATGTTPPGRAHFAEAGAEYAVIGTDFIEIASSGTITTRGTVAVDANPATISSNGDGGGELFITSGGNGYVYDIATTTLTQIAALNGIATMGDQMNGYFIALDAATSTWYISDLYDGTTWDTGTNFAQRSAASDPWVSLYVLNGAYIWLFGERTSEVWYNAGTFPFPFEPHPSGRGIQWGCEEAFTPAQVQGRLLWLSRTRSGDGIVMSTNGFLPERVSTPSIEYGLQNANTSGATSDTYDEAGHQFYQLHTSDITFQYDLSTGLWNKVGSWDPALGAFNVWRPRFHAFIFGEHRWLDSETAAIYVSSLAVGTDADGAEIRRVRRAPAVINENKRVFYPAFELLMDTGLGLVTGQGSDPQVMMRYSDDGGKTWTPEWWTGAGKQGQYNIRVRWNRCGAGRRRVFEVAVSDPIPWRIVDAYLPEAYLSEGVA